MSRCPQSRRDGQSANTMMMSPLLVLVSVLMTGVAAQQSNVMNTELDFSQAEEDPVTGQLCLLQRVCLANPEALAKRLPQESCFPAGCTCNGDADCADGGHCVDCNCSRFPKGCSCNGDRDCDKGGFCVDCNCSPFPKGCSCGADSDCTDGGFCTDCNCSQFRKGCTCNGDGDCANGGFCVDCQCSTFPPGCDCSGDTDCGEGPKGKESCVDCKCSRFPRGCNCSADDDCGGDPADKCVACVCKNCPASTKSSSTGLLNPPLTFVVDTTKSVRPDKYSIFNLTQKVVERIVETKANIPSYLLVTFNDLGPDIRQNTRVFAETPDVFTFKQDIVELAFESFDGGRDSKERLMQGLVTALNSAPEKGLIVVFTDNGSKDLNLKKEVLRLKKEKQATVYIVLTPIFEGFPNDPSLDVYAEVADEVFFIAEVGADVFLSSVQTFEESNCL